MTAAEKLVAKLELQEEREWEKRCEQKKQEALHPKITDEAKNEQKISMLCQLRKRTADIHYQLELDRQLTLEKDRLLQASMKLREANLTSLEGKARSEEIRRGQILFSKVIPGLSPNWREEATLAFKNKRL
jgi:hypothetical protein